MKWLSSRVRSSSSRTTAGSGGKEGEEGWEWSVALRTKIEVTNMIVHKLWEYFLALLDHLPKWGFWIALTVGHYKLVGI
jgi:hypothetical protein